MNLLAQMQHFLVSASGFCDTAVAKAKSLNIRVFTYKEAAASDWTQCLLLKEITHFIQRWDNILIIFLKPLTNRIIDPQQSIVDAPRENINALIFVTEQDEPKASIPLIANMVINQNISGLFQDVTVGKRLRKRTLIDLKTPQNEPQLFFRDARGSLRKLERFCLEADFWLEVHRAPVHLSKYSNAGTSEALAEVASTTINAWGGEHKLQIIAKFLGEQGSQVLMRLQKKD